MGIYRMCDESTGAATGPTGSIQFHHAGTEISGSDYLVFTTSSSPFTLDITGTLNVSGTINAQELNVDVHHKNVSNIDVAVQQSSVIH